MTTPGNILKGADRMMPGGDGYKRDIQSISFGTASGTTLATLTAGRGFTMDASAESVLYSFNLTSDYDESSDHAVLRVAYDSNTADSSNYISFALSSVRRASGVDAVFEEDTTLTDIAAVVVNATGGGFLEFDLSGRGYKGGDQVSATVEATMTGTASVDIYQAQLEIKSTLVPYNVADR